MKPIASMRKNYELGELDETGAPIDPLAQFKAWLDEAIGHLRDHAVTEATRRQAYEWADAAIEAIDPLPAGVVRDALVKLAHVIVDRSS